MEIYKSNKIETDLTLSTDLFVQSRIKSTRLHTSAVLSHSRFLKFFQNLTDSWFITNMEEGRKNTLVHLKVKNILINTKKIRPSSSFGLEF